MPLLDIWKETPEQLSNKLIYQLIAFAGGGKLLDDSDCSLEFRSFLESVPSENLGAYAEQCLNQSFQDSGLALQDIVNQIGFRLGAAPKFGRYRGNQKYIGYDGLWKFPSGHSIVVEVKTTDAYRIDLDTIAAYRLKLIALGELSEANSSMLLIVGRQDTGDLEAQIRGSRHAWDIRIISVRSLMNMVRLKEELEDPLTIQKIHSILIPREFTRLDDIAEVLFSATEEIKKDETPIDVELQASDGVEQDIKVAPVAFHDACVKRVQAHLHVSLIKRSRAGYSTPDNQLALNCTVSKEHNIGSNPNYWFAFHPHQQEFLAAHASAYVAFGCGTSQRLLLVPYLNFKPWLEGMGTTQKGSVVYWHVLIDRVGFSYSLRKKKGMAPIDLTSFLVPEIAE